jgi:hypothetical protein
VRTDRIAVARNRILQEIEQDKEIGQFDYLAVLDMDFPNSCPLPVGEFRKAIDFLDANSNVAGVFPNSLPLYYDIWALRAKDWCPGDCWEEVARAQPSLSLEAATEKYVYARQRFIEPLSDPIEVESAFGGIGLYRLRFVQGKRYSGLTTDGDPVCEHVAFHAAVRHEGAKFFILPFFRNLSASDHTNLFRTHIMMSLGAVSILVGKDVAARYAHYPRSGERFADLAALYSSHGGETVFDCAPQNGALLVQARLRGCTSGYACVADNDLELAVLGANALMQEQVFANHFSGCGPIGFAQRPGLVRLGNAKDASQMVSLPIGETPWVLWARVEGPDEAADWTGILDESSFEWVTAFNALGTSVASGPLATQKEKLTILFSRLPKSGGGLDLVFFSAGTHALYEAFHAQL